MAYALLLQQLLNRMHDKAPSAAYGYEYTALTSGMLIEISQLRQHV
jgi:hypothetical protein